MVKGECNNCLEPDTALVLGALDGIYIPLDFPECEHFVQVKVISTFQCTPELQGLAAMVHARRAQYRTQFVQLQPRLLAINDTFFSRAMFSFGNCTAGCSISWWFHSADNFVWSQSILRSRCWSKNEVGGLDFWNAVLYLTWWLSRFRPAYSYP